MDYSKIKQKRTRQEDYEFVYNLTKSAVKGIVEKYLKWDKKVFDRDFAWQKKTMKILWSGKRRIGFYLVHNRTDHIFVSKLYFIKSYRGRGLGRHMMEKFERTKKGKVVLDVWKGNKAIEFYKKLGYKRTGKNGHLIVMEKKLR